MTPLRIVADESLTERARSAVATAAEFADVVDRENRFPFEAVKALKDRRLLGAAAPAEFGGEGAAMSEISAVCAALAGACASTAMIFAMHQINMVNLIDCGLESAWHRAYLARAVREQLLFASATTEAGVGGDLRHSICALERSGEEFTLVKSAPVISYGEYADSVFATARRNPDAPSSDQVLVVLPREDCEMERVSTWDALGMRGTCSHGYRLKCTGPAEQVLPKPFADIAAESMVAASHLLWSSVWYGVAAEALARAQRFVAAQARGQAGALPPGAPRLAEAFGRLRGLEASIKSLLGEWEAARSDPTWSLSLAINALKVSVSVGALEIVSDAMMICGLQAYKNDGPHSLGRHLRDIHSARLMISNDRILNSTAQMLLVQRRPAAAAG